MSFFKRLDWRTMTTVLIVCTVVPLASIALVRYHNRDRAMVPAVIDALVQLQSIPDSILSNSVSAAAWRFRITEMEEQITAGQMPVDSVRFLYHEYAAFARDGDLTADEIRQLARVFNLEPVSKPSETPGGDTI